MITAAEYLRETSLAMNERYEGDCVGYACRIAQLLRAEGRLPWIGRLRHVTREGAETMHWPLIPKRYAGRSAPVWNTHYVCCSERAALDPLVGEPIDLDAYAPAVFGLEIKVQVHLSAAETQTLLDKGELRSALQRAGLTTGPITQRM